MDTNEPSSKVIMVVDDDDGVLSFLSFSLKEEGFRVLPFTSASAALKALETGKPHLILLDIMMPEMNGFEMCTEVRANSAFKDIPILFITAYADANSPKKAVEAGAQGLIEKPIIFSELLVQIWDALTGNISFPTRLKYSSGEDQGNSG